MLVDILKTNVKKILQEKRNKGLKLDNKVEDLTLNTLVSKDIIAAIESIEKILTILNVEYNELLGKKNYHIDDLNLYFEACVNVILGLKTISGTIYVKNNDISSLTLSSYLNAKEHNKVAIDEKYVTSAIAKQYEIELKQLIPMIIQDDKKIEKK